VSEVKKDAEVTATVSKEEYDKIVKERDDYKTAFENNGRQAQAIIEEKSAIISILIEKIRNMTRG
jgi:hypothetical protein